jgi:hypothetical protein
MSLILNKGLKKKKNFKIFLKFLNLPSFNDKKIVLQILEFYGGSMEVFNKLLEISI